jgi:hypothetical protein
MMSGPRRHSPDYTSGRCAPYSARFPLESRATFIDQFELVVSPRPHLTSNSIRLLYGYVIYLTLEAVLSRRLLQSDAETP